MFLPLMVHTLFIRLNIVVISRRKDSLQLNISLSKLFISTILEFKNAYDVMNGRLKILNTPTTAGFLAERVVKALID